MVLRKLAKAFQETEHNTGEGRPLDYSRRSRALAYEPFPTSAAPPQVCVYMCVCVHMRVCMAPHSSTLAWKIPWMEEPGGLQSMGSPRVGHTEQLHVHFSLSCIGEGNGNQLQCSCLENPRDGGAWWAAVYGVAQSWTRLT